MANWEQDDAPLFRTETIAPYSLNARWREIYKWSESRCAARLRWVCEGVPAARVAELTGTNHETTRRYLSGNRIPARFIAEICRVANVRPEWLLFGHPPVRAKSGNVGERKRSSQQGPSPPVCESSHPTASVARRSETIPAG